MLVPTTLSWNPTTRHALQTVLKVNIVAVVMMIVASQYIGHVTENVIVPMDRMNLIALPSAVNRECFNVKIIKRAFQEYEFVTELRIVMINQMKHSVTHLVENMHSSVNHQDAAFPIHGNVMVMMIVPMEVMKIHPFVTIVNVTHKLNTSAKMESVFLNYGFVTLKMIAETIPMNQPTDVGIVIVPQDGRSVPHAIITVVSRLGYFVTEKMIVGMDLMKLILMIVPSAMKVGTSSAKMVVASH